MAFLTVDCFSEVLHMSVNLNVILPQNINIINPVNGGHFKPPYRCCICFTVTMEIIRYGPGEQVWSGMRLIRASL